MGELFDSKGKSSKSYSEVAECLFAEIREGKYSAGNSFPSLTRIASRFGVTRVTAMRSVDELKKRGVVSAAPRSGMTVIAPNRTIGLIIPGVAYSEFFSMIMDGISQSCQKVGYSLLVGNVYSKSHEIRAQQAKNLAADFVRKGVAGVIFQPIEFIEDATRINNEILAILSDAGIPVVLIDSDVISLSDHRQFDLVGINNFDAGRRLAEHLIANGANNIHFMMRCHWSVSVRNRLYGIKSAILTGGGGNKCLNILQADPSDAEKINAYLKKHRPDAIVCGNDTTAAYLRRTLDVLGKRVPEDIMIAGFDDVQHASLMIPQLTTIHQPCSDIAELAVCRILSRIGNPNQTPIEILLPSPLIERGSTRRIAPDRRCSARACRAQSNSGSRQGA